MSKKIREYQNFTPKQGDYIVFKIKPYEYSAEELKELFEGLQDKFCNNSIIFIPEDIDIELCDKKELIADLKKIIKNLEEKDS